MYLSLKYPGNRGIICRKVANTLKHTTQYVFENYVCPPSLIAEHNKQDRHYKLVNGSEIIFGGLDDPQKWASFEAGWVGIDEAIETDEDDWTMLSGRLSLQGVPLTPIFAACNPGSPAHYLHRYFFQEGGAHRELIETNTFDNPHLPQHYLDRVGRFKGRYRERYVEGKWVSFEGLVYDVFNPATHIIDPFPIPSEWPRVLAVDFGYVHPFVCWWFALAPDGKWHGYREIYHTKRLVSDHARQMRELSRGENIVAVYCDHDAEDFATLQRELPDWPLRKATKDVNPGIEEVYKVLANDRLYFFADATVEIDPVLEMSDTEQTQRPRCTFEEFGLYERPKPKPGSREKELPLKRHDHGMDTIRYAVYSHLFGAKEPVGEAYTSIWSIGDGEASERSSDSESPLELISNWIPGGERW
jgi:phage terminase large subunit